MSLIKKIHAIKNFNDRLKEDAIRFMNALANEGVEEAQTISKYWAYGVKRLKSIDLTMCKNVL